jgi:hypothetical protein
MDLDSLAAQYVLRCISTEDLKDHAYTAMLAGYESPSLAALAGAEKTLTSPDLRDLFEAALRELGIELPGRLKAGLAMKRMYARQVVSGELTPRDGAGHIVALFHELEGELQKSHHYAGDNFGIAQIIGCYYAYDDTQDHQPPDAPWIQRLDESIVTSCARIARGEDTGS